MYTLDASIAALGWAFHVTKHIDALSPKVYFDKGVLVIEAKNKKAANSISKRIHTDPSYRSSSFKYLPIAIRVETSTWDEFTLAEIQSVLSFRGVKRQSLILPNNLTIKEAS